MTSLDIQDIIEWLFIHDHCAGSSKEWRKQFIDMLKSMPDRTNGIENAIRIDIIQKIERIGERYGVSWSGEARMKLEELKRLFNNS